MSGPKTRPLLRVAIGLGACVAVILAVWLSGVRALSVESGSMGSALPVGSLAITRPVPATALTPGDVVSVAGQHRQPVTHRVVTTNPVGDGSTKVSLVLKGDANAVPDADPVVVPTADIVVAGIPYAGVVSDAMTSGPGLVALAFSAVILLVRRRSRFSGLVVVMGTSLALVSTGTTSAVFSDSGTVDSGALTSGAVSTPSLPTASQAVTTGVVNIGFTATTVGTQGAAPSEYEVYRYPAATGGTGTLVCATSSTFACTELRTALATGTYHYAVRAKFATNWFAESSRRAYSHDATAPTVTVVRPLAGSAGGLNQLRNSITGTCSSSAVGCGTSADSGGGTVGSVQYTLRRDQVRSSGTTYSCWSGSAWSASATGVCTFATASSNTSGWWIAGSVNTAYVSPPNGTTYSYVLVARGTDTFGNLATGTTVNFST